MKTVLEILLLVKDEFDRRSPDLSPNSLCNAAHRLFDKGEITEEERVSFKKYYR